MRWIALAMALVVLAVGTWIRWRAPRQPSTDRAVLSVRRFPELAGTLVLSVQSRRRIEILPGTPLQFEVSLGAGKGIAPSAVGRSGQPWHSLIRLVGRPALQPPGWAVIPLGSPRSMAFGARDAGGLKLTESVADVAMVDHDHVHHVVLAASPEAMSAVAQGTYHLQAVLEGESRLESAPVTVIVRGPGETPDRSRLERERVARSAEFYLQANRFEDARRLSQELASREPKNPGAWMLLGDALDGLGKPGEALKVYRRALAVSPRTYEEPTLLYERMGAVGRKLAKS